MNDQFLNKNFDGEAFLNALHNITGIAPARTRFDFADKTSRIEMAKNFREYVQAYIDRPAQRMRERVQAYVKTSDLPDMITRTFDLFYDVSNFDLLWQFAFKDAADRIEAGRNYWEIATMTEGSSWAIIPEGAEVKIRTRTGTKVKVEVVKVGDGIGFTDEMIRFRQLGPMLDMIEDFRNGYNRQQANLFYALMASAAGTVVPSSGAGVGTTLERDIDTINRVCLTLLTDMKNTRNLPITHPIILFLPPGAQARVNRALGELSQAFAGSEKRIVYNVMPYYTFNANLPTLTGETFTGIACIPGYKSQWAQLLDPQFYDDTDVMSLTYIRTAFAYYGGACADTTQLLRFGLA